MEEDAADRIKTGLDHPNTESVITSGRRITHAEHGAPQCVQRHWANREGARSYAGQSTVHMGDGSLAGRLAGYMRTYLDKVLIHAVSGDRR